MRGKSAEVGGDLGSPPHTACTHNQPRDPSAAQTEALSPLASSTQSSREDVSRLEFKSPGLTLRLLRVSKGPLRFKLGTLPIFHPYRPPETLPLLPLFCKLLWKLREKEVCDAQVCLASSPQRVYGRLGPFASSNDRPGAACSPAQTWGLHYAQVQHGPGRASSSPGPVSRLEPETPLGTRSIRL